MSAPRPFKISIPDETLKLLAKKLSVASFPDELDDAGWDLGAPLSDVKRLTAFWRDGFDWRKQEAKINELPQYMTEIDVDRFGPLQIHFVHQKSRTKDAIPLLFVHGWPGSFLEVSKILPLLAEPTNGAPAFHVVAPSLPNFGFSDGTKKRGFGLGQHAEVCSKLMQQLGYSQYVTQGGDIGFYITRALGLLYPSACRASHINYIHAGPPTWAKHPLLALQHATTPYSDREKKGLARRDWFMTEGSGYRMEHATKPQTLGYSLADSPVGLLAWIYEKMHDWTDDYPWTDDEVLTWVSVYWFSTAGPAASVRIYYENTHDPDRTMFDRVQDYIPDVPLGLASSPKDLLVVPKLWGRTLGPVIYENDYQRGGHFATSERPEAVVHDLQTMFGKDGGAYGVVEGRDGYGGSPTNVEL